MRRGYSTSGMNSSLPRNRQTRAVEQQGRRLTNSPRPPTAASRQRFLRHNPNTEGSPNTTGSSGPGTLGEGWPADNHQRLSYLDQFLSEIWKQECHRTRPTHDGRWTNRTDETPNPEQPERVSLVSVRRRFVENQKGFVGVGASTLRRRDPPRGADRVAQVSGNGPRLNPPRPRRRQVFSFRSRAPTDPTATRFFTSEVEFAFASRPAWAMISGRSRHPAGAGGGRRGGWIFGPVLRTLAPCDTCSGD